MTEGEIHPCSHTPFFVMILASQPNRVGCRVHALAVTVVLSAWMAACNPTAIRDPIASAEAALARGDAAAAVVEGKRAVQGFPEAWRARLVLGNALLRSGDANTASVELERAAQLGAPMTAVAEPLARSMTLTRQPRAVTDRFAALDLGDTAATAQLKVIVAAAYVAQRMPAQAERAIEQALALDPRNRNARLLQAQVAAGKGQRAEALKLVERLVEDDPKLPDAWQLRGDLVALDSGDWASAVRFHEKALELDPKHVPSHAALLYERLLARDIKGFGDRLEKLKVAFPAHPETLHQEGQFALLKGDLDRAREIANALLQSLPDSPRALLFAGSVEARRGSLVLAESHYSKAVQRDPDAAEARLLLAEVQMKLNQPARAFATLQPLVQLELASALGMAAQAQLTAGRLAEAEGLFKRAAAVSRSGDTRSEAAMAYTQVMRGQVAAGFERLAALASKSKETHADLAMVSLRMRRGEYVEAERALQSLESKQPGLASTASLLGDVAVRRGDTAAARQHFERALRQEPNSFAALSRLATLDVSDGNRLAAISRLQGYVAREPRDFVALRSLLALEVQNGRSLDDIRKQLTELVTRYPSDPAPRVLLVSFLLDRNEPSAAVTAAQDAASALPGVPEIQEVLGLAQLASGSTQQALSTFGQMVASQPASVSANMRLAQTHLSVRDYGPARQLLRRVIEIDRNQLPAYTALFDAALAERDYRAARATATLVQERFPFGLTGYEMEAAAHLTEGNVGAAVRAFKTAFERRPETETVIAYHRGLLSQGQKEAADRVAASWRSAHPNDLVFVSFLGHSALTRSEFAVAERQFRLVAAAKPEYAPALNNLAYALLRQGKPEALEMARRADAKRPNDPRIMDTLAAALAQGKQLPEALALQRRAVAAASDSAIYRLHLAELLIQSGDKAAAKTELEALRRLGGRFSESQRVNEMLRTL